jgi:hypothetical protein
MTTPRDPHDPAIVRAPWGPDVDGRRLLAESVGFGRALRAAGLATDLGAAVDFTRALGLIDIGERETVRRPGGPSGSATRGLRPGLRPLRRRRGRAQRTV